jgi:chromosome condensin MukBEF ATPase and DNA-binding subunit MukB
MNPEDGHLNDLSCGKLEDDSVAEICGGEVELTVMVQDVPVVYKEYPNKWHFSRGGKEYSVDSVREAREIIRKPIKVVFKRQKAWYNTHSHGYVIADVTSLANGLDYDKKKRYWVSYRETETTKDISRTTESESRLFAFTPENAQLAADYKFIQDQISALEKRQKAIASKFARFYPVAP